MYAREENETREDPSLWHLVITAVVAHRSQAKPFAKLHLASMTRCYRGLTARALAVQ
jgi:hypothetical protein